MREEVPPVLQHQILQLALDLPANKFSWFRMQVKESQGCSSFADLDRALLCNQLFFLCVFLFFPGCCGYRILIWREVSTLPAPQDVCQQQRRTSEDLHADAGS